jgi:radical SAM protein with 4Fe4S-binding SPASM domain
METLHTLSSKTVCRLAGAAMDLTLSRLPPLLRIETTNACNSKCTICRHRQIQRPIQQMDEGRFTQIIDQGAAWGCREVHLHNFGEPLLDDRLEAHVRYAKQRGVARVKIFTNGSLLDELRARSLIDAGLDEIKISFDGASKEEFERIRFPLKFDCVIGNIDRLVALRNRLRAPMKIVATCCSTSDKQATLRLLSHRVDGLVFGKIHNWTGPQTGNGHHRVRKPCARLWRTLTVLANGDVALCCLDYDGQHVLGRINTDTSLQAVWRSAAYEELRQRHKDARQGEISLCKSCSKSFV